MSKTCIITLNYNNSADTIQFINSLQSTNAIPQIIIVDNGSTETNFSNFKINHDNIVTIYLETNLGYGRGNNVGINWALTNTDCEYILLLNNDVCVQPGCVELLENYMDQHATIAVCAPRIMFAHNQDMIWYGGGDINWRHGGGVSWNIYKKFDGDVTPRAVTFISGCAMMFRRDLLIHLGGFDPRFFMYCEDIELCARIISNGYKMVYVPAAVVTHRCHGSLRSIESKYFVDYETSVFSPNLAFTVKNIVCNTLIIYSIYPRTKEKLIGLLFLAAKWMRNCTRFLVAGRFDGIRAIFAGIKLFWTKRKMAFINELDVQTIPIKK